MIGSALYRTACGFLLAFIACILSLICTWVFSRPIINSDLPIEAQDAFSVVIFACCLGGWLQLLRR